ncbi:hypothetical protein [Nocardia sp. alder85J]|uniref:hypothetical protein n=1 Tax=Nocardia sp. alder85J TaxID=2862949 RepID=UPI001CD3EB27|nr:hypothetical protein [Nocardia sp. alder85J]MCX4092997.1 hypothetical protein [Nocardia sp. alder85J]
MTETMRPVPLPPTAMRGRLIPLGPPLQATESAEGTVAFAELGCRLARRLFDASLRLDALHAVYDRPDSTREELRTAGVAIGDVLDQLSLMLHDTGKTILAQAIDHIPDDPARLEWPDPLRRTRRKPVD